MTQTPERTSMRELRPATQVDPTFQMFASRSVAIHVVRGVLGLVTLVAGIALASQSGWFLLLLPLTVALWRGCPTCWVMGLIATRGHQGTRRQILSTLEPVVRSDGTATPAGAGPAVVRGRARRSGDAPTHR